MKIKIIKKFDKKISDFIFTLRNKNYVRINSLDNKKIKKNDHNFWFKKFLKKKNFFYIITYKSNLVGYVRLDKKKGYYYVSWALLKKYHGNKITKRSLNYVTNLKSIKYKAKIKRDNFASIKVAINSGFKRKLKKNQIYYFQKN